MNTLCCYELSSYVLLYLILSRFLGLLDIVFCLFEYFLLSYVLTVSYLFF